MRILIQAIAQTDIVKKERLNFIFMQFSFKLVAYTIISKQKKSMKTTNFANVRGYCAQPSNINQICSDQTYVTYTEQIILI